ncbi:MAG: hypothetical protein AWU55_1648 [Halomonadaceae bacterium T82-2]|nr:MAG: hypothetical protein AWU55_1648 [Halomonadaceae bacterium T82-2]
MGRSPRVRGSRAIPQGRRARDGSIPAGAGKPFARRASRPRHRVDPRGCGEVARSMTGTSGGGGRSPRVRGSRRWRTGQTGGERSIPAGAGKPASAGYGCQWSGVDPRGCGEATVQSSVAIGRQGRSPRVRGSQVRQQERQRPAGSIPAGAGKPRKVGRGYGTGKVDPRGCGEAPIPTAEMRKAMGRSPRVRGSLDAAGGAAVVLGSIPAGAGKPPRSCPSHRAARVDPRGCGEAISRASRLLRAAGRSPRVRGSRIDVGICQRCSGSIPAGAGKPR